jgi:hypothetical protein
MVNTTAGQALHMASKLLNMRHFRTFEGFPLGAKTRYKSNHGNPGRAPAWPISAGMALHAKTAIGQPQFRAYMQQTHP